MLLASLALLVLAAALLALGMKGRRIDDHPICRKCRFDLVGLASPAKCPECGTPLNNPAAIRHGVRRRRPAAIVVGSVLLVIGLGLFGVTTWSRATSYNWNTVKPTWWLVHEAEHEVTPDDAVLTELLARRSADKIDSATYRRLVSHALVRQTDLNRGWSVLWGDLVEDARSRDEMTSAQYQQFLTGAIITTVAFRPRITSGKPLPYSVSMDLSRSSRAMLAYSIKGGEIEIEVDDGQPLKFPVSGGIGISGFSGFPTFGGSANGLSSSIYIAGKVPPGKRRTTLQLATTTSLDKPVPARPSAPCRSSTQQSSSTSRRTRAQSR